MRLLGFEITRAAPPASRPVSAWGGYGSGRGWYPLVIRDHYPGAWQRNDELRVDSVLAFPAVFACQTLIASDISKLGIRLVRRDSNGIWSETSNPAYSPVLRKPNHFQTRIQFIESWVISKYEFGNAYVLKERDGRGVVVALYVLDPCKVTPLVTPNGEVFYQLRKDELAGLEVESDVTVPAREIIHDRFNCFFHPLVGLSPIFANGLAALGGLAIEKSSADFFANGSRIPGILTAPGAIGDDTAERLKTHWEENYTGSHAGRVAVLGDGLKFEAMAVKAADAQLIEQLKWSAETVCSTYHVPPYKIGVGQMPTYNNIQALNTEYYSQCLQAQIEQMELCLDEGLGLTEDLGVEFDIDNLLRMDSQTLITAIKDGTGAGVMKPNEGRKRLNLSPVPGGDTPYLQVQNYSLAALSKRDKSDDPFAPSSPPPPPPPANDDTTEPPADQAAADKALATIIGGLQ